MSRKAAVAGEPIIIKDPYGKHYPCDTVISGPSMTHQCFTDECDINNIMAKYERTGLLEHVNRHQGQYGEFIDAPSYQEAQNLIIEANNMFMEIPAAVRAKFENSPAKFLEFVQDPNNLPEMYELGLAIKPAPVQDQILDSESKKNSSAEPT